VDDQSFFAAVLRQFFGKGIGEYWGIEQPIGKTEQKDNVLSVRTLEPYLFMLGGFDMNSAVTPQQYTTPLPLSLSLPLSTPSPHNPQHTLPHLFLFSSIFCYLGCRDTIENSEGGAS